MSLRLFTAFGVEIEYMLVDAQTLDVLPAADHLIRAAAGGEAFVNDVERGPITWSNELALHVVEFKVSEPAPQLGGLAAKFAVAVRDANQRLQPLGGRLLPTGMHPWMNPLRETRLWPHEYNVVYERFNEIFDCRGHGWSNLQSMHLNLPFADDAEFGRLHAAIRLVLPILPALAASSPVIDGRLTGTLDNRLAAYRTNAARVPSISGQVIPEQAFTRDEYEDRILLPIYRDLAPFDPEGVLQEEWANARGAIARFDRNTIEIRVLDTQECPAADLAVAAATVAVLKALVEERWSTFTQQQAWQVEPLARLLLESIRVGDAAVIEDPAYLRMFGSTATRCTAGELWRHLAGTLGEDLRRADPEFATALRVISQHGSLAHRIVAALGPEPSRERLRAVYADLAECLVRNEQFQPA